MGHYAKVLEGKVLNVIVAQEDFFDNFVDDSPGEWIKTSYNTHGGVHTLGGTPLRMNYASIGGNYDRENDAFYGESTCKGWVLNTETYTWEPPVPIPVDGDKMFRWDEEDEEWVEFIP